MSFSQRPATDDTTWVLTDGHAGNLRQAEALARALHCTTPHAPGLFPTAPWRWLAPRLLPGSRHAFGPGFAAGLARPPALAIGCGRQGALATRLLRRRGSRAVQILDPRIDPRHWDLVVAPEHDALRGDNVIAVLGSLNPVDEDWLATAAARYPALQRLPGPRLVLLLGGPTRHAPWDVDALPALLDCLRQWTAAAGGSLLATVSRRTPAAALDALRAGLRGVPGLLWDGSGANPYPGMLACADQLVCSPDSVNMLSEACATATPVHVFQPACTDGRIGRFLRSLLERERVRAFDAEPVPFVATPLRETARVAAIVRQRLSL